MKLLKHLSAVDIINGIFWLVMVVFYLMTFNQSEFKLQAFVLLSLLAVFMWLVIWVRSKDFQSVFAKILLIFYPALFLIFVFDSLHMILPYINPNVYDEALAKLDYQMLGINPTVWIEDIIYPYLTEFMYYLYLFYFPMPLILLRYLYKQKMFVELDQTILLYFTVYYGSYLLYFVVPALGPRFYTPLAELQKVPLDGLFLTDLIRDTINSLEHNKFDAFPSLHAAISMTTLMAIAKYRKRWLYFFVPVIIGIFISLIYCRYHYVVDIIGGVIWTLISYWLVERFVQSKLAQRYVPFYEKKNPKS